MEQATETAVPLFDPTVGAETEAGERAARPGGLAGKRIGLLWNSKVGGDRLMRFVVEELRGAGADPALTVELSKEYDTRPAPPEVYAEMAERCDLAITAVGD